MLRSSDARQEGNLGSYCWDFEGGGQCADTFGYNFPRADATPSGRAARIRIRRNHKPSSARLHAWRHVDEDGQPQGDGWRVARDIKKRARDGRTVYDIVFRLPKKPGHLYLSLFARWRPREGRYGAGDASYDFHLKLR